MATSVQVNKFCNEQIRPLCDRYVGLYLAAKEAQALYIAQGIATALGADNNVVITDGSDVDGRSIITVGDVKTAITNLGTLITSVEASGNTLLNQMAKVSVNPS